VGRSANDNRDQRDNAIRELATLIDVRVMYSDSGEAKVELANGFSLVQGTVTAELSTLPDPQNNGLLSIQYTSVSGVTTDITGAITAGELGGQLEARDRVLPRHMAEIDGLAFSFINEVNTIHSAGFGLDGINGRDLFVPTAAVQGSSLAMAVNPDILADNSRIAAAIDPVGLPGDNQNLLRLADLQQTHHAALGGVSFNHFYAETIRSVGQSVKEVDQLSLIYDTRFDQSESLRESIEGVSIDDEMVDLSRFQKHFEASARVMDTVNRLMESVLQLVQ
jgi:flagellar hook-associated protein 1 FlgK